MQSVLLNSQLSQRLRRQGMDRARQFTWERCARETLDVLMRVGGALRN
jgi:glycosyltransferase involved in cell wall biosynthesis